MTDVLLGLSIIAVLIVAEEACVIWLWDQHFN
jgi:hypothetical protein